MRKRIRKLCSNLLSRSCGYCARRSIVRCIVVSTWYSNLLYFGHVSRFLLGKNIFGICDLWRMYKTCERCCGHMWLGIRLSVVFKREHSRRFYSSPEGRPSYLQTGRVHCCIVIFPSSGHHELLLQTARGSDRTFVCTCDLVSS
jgi:hypothetical protein